MVGRKSEPARVMSWQILLLQREEVEVSVGTLGCGDGGGGQPQLLGKEQLGQL